MVQLIVGPDAHVQMSHLHDATWRAALQVGEVGETKQCLYSSIYGTM